MSSSHKAVSSLYNEIFGYYESVNSLLTLGFDRYWRSRAAGLIREKIPGQPKILDICCGTGDFTLSLRRTFGSGCPITACDLNALMLEKARKKLPEITFIEADCASLPFPDSTFDLVTISFATRNIFLNEEDFRITAKEILRVMKKGAIFASLETTVPEKTIPRKIMFFFTKTGIGAVNFLNPKASKSYSFLSQTIINFKTAKEFSSILLSCGFTKVYHKILCPGAVALHICEK